MIKDYEISTITEVLNKIFKEINFSSEDGLISLSNKWETVVGANIGANSRIIDVKNHVLTVEVLHPGWYQMIILKKNSLLRDIKTNYPELEVEKISIVLKK